MARYSAINELNPFMSAPLKSVTKKLAWFSKAFFAASEPKFHRHKLSKGSQAVEVSSAPFAVTAIILAHV